LSPGEGSNVTWAACTGTCALEVVRDRFTTRERATERPHPVQEPAIPINRYARGEPRRPTVRPTGPDVTPAKETGYPTYPPYGMTLATGHMARSIRKGSRRKPAVAEGPKSPRWLGLCGRRGSYGDRAGRSRLGILNVPQADRRGARRHDDGARVLHKRPLRRRPFHREPSTFPPAGHCPASPPPQPDGPSRQGCPQPWIAVRPAKGGPYKTHLSRNRRRGQDPSSTVMLPWSKTVRTWPAGRGLRQVSIINVGRGGIARSCNGGRCQQRTAQADHLHRGR